MTTYPDTLPGPTISGFGATVVMGVIRSGMDTHQTQRRVHATMPHTFTLSFVLSLTEWAQWQLWVSEYGYRWFEINLPTLYAGSLLENTSLVKIRLTSDITGALLAGDQAQVSVTAEMAPSMIADYFEGIA